MPGGGLSGEEHGARGVHDGAFEHRQVHLDQGRAVHVAQADGVEADVDAPSGLGDAIGVGRDLIRVEGIDHRGVHRPTRGADVRGGRVERGGCASGQVDGGSFTGESGGNRSSDGARAAVDDRILAFQQHDVLPVRGSSCG